MTKPKEAKFYAQHSDFSVTCELCPHQCKIQHGKTGICKVRKNYKGQLYALAYSGVSSVSMDPIEKKPLYHFFPGKEILSLGSVGCNFKCEFCQNWQISQKIPSLKMLSPSDLLELAKREKENIGVAYTYNEPLINYEFIYDCAKLLNENGFKNVLVTNGYINREPLLELIPYIDAMNIDLKAFDNIFYEKYCKGSLAPVLNTIKTAFENNVHIEVTNLLIPTLNDSKEHINKLIEWLASLSENIPLHISRYYPNYKMNIAPTSVEALQRVRQKGLKHLKFVYLGNILDKESNTTFCSSCNKPVIERIGYNVEVHLKGNMCKFCGAELNIVNN